MIAFRFYRTHGYGCERMRFVRKGRHKWQRVVKFLCFYWPIGAPILEHECNYFRGKP